MSTHAAFTTGSRAYGTPKPESDLDVAVLVDKETILELIMFSDKGKKGLHFGRLNLLVFDGEDNEDHKNFHKWREVTERLCAAAPVTRETAISEFTIADCYPKTSYDVEGFEK